MTSSRIRSILAYVDTADPRGHPALTSATRIARAAGARLTLADVVPEISTHVQRMLPDGLRLPQLLRAESIARLRRLAGAPRRAGVLTDTLTLEGATADALVREISRGGHDLLTVTLRSDDRGGATLGTRLARRAPCSVWLMPHRRPGGSGRRRPRVLAAIDVEAIDGRTEQADAASMALAARVLETAAELCVLQGGDLHVVHAWTAYGEMMLRQRPMLGVSRPEVEEYVARMERSARNALHAAVAPFAASLPPDRVHLVKGHPDQVIPPFAMAHMIDTLVMGTVARSGLAGFIIGNTAERILEAPPCAVLVVKSDRAAALRSVATEGAARYCGQAAGHRPGGSVIARRLPRAVRQKPC